MLLKTVILFLTHLNYSSLQLVPSESIKKSVVDKIPMKGTIENIKNEIQYIIPRLNDTN